MPSPFRHRRWHSATRRQRRYPLGRAGSRPPATESPARGGGGTFTARVDVRRRRLAEDPASLSWHALFFPQFFMARAWCWPPGQGRFVGGAGARVRGLWTEQRRPRHSYTLDHTRAINGRHEYRPEAQARHQHRSTLVQMPKRPRRGAESPRTTRITDGRRFFYPENSHGPAT
jgi:hypothetical protein